MHYTSNILLFIGIYYLVINNVILFSYPVGKPIPVPKVENPSKELIDEYHTKFVTALSALFEENKHKYDEAGSEAKLVML